MPCQLGLGAPRAVPYLIIRGTATRDLNELVEDDIVTLEGKGRPSSSLLPCVGYLHHLLFFATLVDTVHFECRRFLHPTLVRQQDG